MATTPVKLDYTQYDFNDLVSQLLSRNSEWADKYVSGTGETIIDAYAYVANMLLYYVARRAEEVCIKTARNKSSVINLVALLNYKPKRNVSSRGQLTFSVTSSTETISIPAKTECQTTNGVKVSTIQEILLEGTSIPGTTTATADALQGAWITIDYTVATDATTDTTYLINDTQVENDDQGIAGYSSIEIWVGTGSTTTYRDTYVQWTQVDTFLDSTPDSTHYIVVPNLDDTVSIQFGDNTNGKYPNGGDVVIINYLRSDGLSGNITGSNLVTTINSDITSTNTVTVTNGAVQFTGGDDAENIEEIREEAPKVFKMGDRLVTKEDYNSYLLNYSGVADVNAWGEAEDIELATLYKYNTVRICLVGQDWTDLLASPEFQSNLEEHMHDKAMLTVRYEWMSPEFVYVIATLDDFKVYTGYGLATTQAAVLATLESLFVLGDTTKLGQNHYYSNIVQAIDDTAGVAYHHLTLKLKKQMTTANSSSSLDYSADLVGVIKTGTIEIYVGSTLLTIASDYTIGSIDYGSLDTNGLVATDGSIEISLSELPDSDVYIVYQQDNNGDVLINNTQICKFDSLVTVTPEYKV